MTLNFNDLLFAFSSGLDYVERSFIGVTTFHARRVAYISASIGEALGMDDQKLLDLVTCAVLHDCALPRSYYTYPAGSPITNLAEHCLVGEKDVQDIPFYTDMKGTVLYHHENVDGSGPFHKKGNEIPETAQLIHLADRLDAECHLDTYHDGSFLQIQKFLQSQCGIMFDPKHVELFLDIFRPDLLLQMQNGSLAALLKNKLPQRIVSHAEGQLRDLALFFAKIIDSKSAFTRRHSIGIAEKAKIMAQYYGYGEEMQEKLYFAGAVHDIGKLAVSNGVLEKPGKLDDKEYAHIKTHAWYTWKILSGIDGMDDIVRWAAYHHEKLDGKGYPFGKTSDDLDQNSRLMACLDIYQALTEPRPYKDGFSHEKTMSMMRDMVSRGFLDGTITEDINHVFI